PAGVDLEVKVRAGSAGIAGVAHEADDGAGVDPSADRAVRAEVGAVVVGAVVSPEMERRAADGVRAVLDGPTDRRDDGRTTCGEHVDALVCPPAGPWRSP